MAQVTFTITVCFHDEMHDRTIVILEDDTASKLTRYLSKYMYGGLPVYLTNGKKKIRDDDPIKSFKEEKLQCLPV
jgi:hypothetical protein